MIACFLFSKNETNLKNSRKLSTSSFQSISKKDRKKPFLVKIIDKLLQKCIFLGLIGCLGTPPYSVLFCAETVFSCWSRVGEDWLSLSLLGHTSPIHCYQVLVNRRATVAPLTDSRWRFQNWCWLLWYPRKWSQSQLFFPDADLPCDGSQLCCFFLRLSVNTDVVSKASCNDGFGEQARQVGQEDVQNGITSCWLLVGLVKSKAVSYTHLTLPTTAEV